jgi:hypothetical protein
MPLSFVNLTEKQRQFLDRRSHTNTDAAAAEGIVSRASVARWKKEPNFYTLYLAACAGQETPPPLEDVKDEVLDEIVQQSVRDLITVDKEKPRKSLAYDASLVETAEAEMGDESVTETDMLLEQLEYLRRFAPLIVKRHLVLLLDARTPAREWVPLAKEFYNMIGLSRESVMPVGRRNQILIETLNILAPQVAARAEERGLEIPQGIARLLDEGTDVVEAEAYEIEDGDYTCGSETEKCEEEESRS